MRKSIMFVYEVLGDSTEVFFIPDAAKLPKPVIDAMKTARNTVMNRDDLSAPQTDAHEIITSAVSEESAVEYIDEPYKKFVGTLLPYKVRGSTSALNVGDKLFYLRCGFVA
jgi:hypothetical protein